MAEVTIKNLIPNPSFEEDRSWGGITYGREYALQGSRSQKFPLGTSVASCPMPKPILGHVYYGRHYLRSEGNNTPADCRFEWFAGDGPGLNFVFGWNRGSWPNWGMESAVIKVEAVTGASYVCRSFVVNGTAPMWADGLMIVDLTAAFGAGKEPDKKWCDSLPFFEDSLRIVIVEQEEIGEISILPNPVTASGQYTVEVTTKVSLIYARTPYQYAAELQSGEVTEWQ